MNSFPWREWSSDTFWQPGNIRMWPAWYAHYVNSPWTADIAGFFIIFFFVVVLAGVVGRLVRSMVQGIGLAGSIGCWARLLDSFEGVVVSAVSCWRWQPSLRSGVCSSRGLRLYVGTSRGLIWGAPASLRQRFWDGWNLLRTVPQHLPTEHAGTAISYEFKARERQRHQRKQRERRRERPTGSFDHADVQKRHYLFGSGMRFKKRFILTVLQDSKGNQCKAARQLGMHRNTLSRTISELKLDAKGVRTEPAVRRAARTMQPSTSGPSGKQGFATSFASRSSSHFQLSCKKKEQPWLLFVLVLTRPALLLGYYCERCGAPAPRSTPDFHSYPKECRPSSSS